MQCPLRDKIDTVVELWLRIEPDHTLARRKHRSSVHQSTRQNGGSIAEIEAAIERLLAPQADDLAD